MIKRGMKPCPFCGEKKNIAVFCSDEKLFTFSIHFDKPVAFAYCFGCDACAGFIEIGEEISHTAAENLAIEAWNRRAAE